MLDNRFSLALASFRQEMLLHRDKLFDMNDFNNFRMKGIGCPAMDEERRPVFAAVQKNQRRTLRVPLIIEKLPCGDGRKTFFGYARNLSRGGVFIPTVNPREPGEQFDLHVTLPTAAGFTLQCRCEVVWRRCFERGGKYEPGMGLRFLDLPQETADRLERWLLSLSP